MATFWFETSVEGYFGWKSQFRKQFKNYCSDRFVPFVVFSSQLIRAIHKEIWPSSDQLPSLYGVSPIFHLNKLIIFGKYGLLHKLCDQCHWSDFKKIQEIWRS